MNKYKFVQDFPGFKNSFLLGVCAFLAIKNELLKNKKNLQSVSVTLSDLMSNKSVNKEALLNQLVFVLFEEHKVLWEQFAKSAEFQKLITDYYEKNYQKIDSWYYQLHNEWYNKNVDKKQAEISAINRKSEEN